MHLAMDALVDITRKLHELKQDYRVLVPKQVFDYATYRGKVVNGKQQQHPFVKCLSEHMKKLGDSSVVDPNGTFHNDCSALEAFANELKDYPWCSISLENEKDEDEKARKEDVLKILTHTEHQLAIAEKFLRDLPHATGPKTIETPGQDTTNPVQNNDSITSILSSLRRLKNQIAY